MSHSGGEIRKQKREWILYADYGDWRKEALAKGSLRTGRFYEHRERVYIYIGIHHGDEPCPTGYHDPADPDVQWFCSCEDKERLMDRQKVCMKRLELLKAELSHIDRLLE